MGEIGLDKSQTKEGALAGVEGLIQGVRFTVPIPNHSLLDLALIVSFGSI